MTVEKSWNMDSTSLSISSQEGVERGLSLHRDTSSALISSSSSSSSSSNEDEYRNKTLESVKNEEMIRSNLKLGYRSVGIGLFGVGMRWVGMPLEKIALYMNSSQVTGANPFAQSIKLTFQEGMLAPYKVVKAPSIVAWFFQYSIMGAAFQVVDQSLSSALNVRPMYYGSEIMEPPSSKEDDDDYSSTWKVLLKMGLAPVLAGSLESAVANRAEVQRYFGPSKFSQIELSSSSSGFVRKMVGPAFLSNACRNTIMCGTTFVLTPIAFKYYVPQEYKSASSLFWFGLGTNIFIGNVFAITQQALWGRSLDSLYHNNCGTISYRSVIKAGLQTEGSRAFFTPAKWSSRVLMNAPAQGTLPWFYNDILPIWEDSVVEFFMKSVYNPLFHQSSLQQQSPMDNQQASKNHDYTVGLQTKFSQ